MWRYVKGEGKLDYRSKESRKLEHWGWEGLRRRRHRMGKQWKPRRPHETQEEPGVGLANQMQVCIGEWGRGKGRASSLMKTKAVEKVLRKMTSSASAFRTVAGTEGPHIDGQCHPQKTSY